MISVHYVTTTKTYPRRTHFVTTSNQFRPQGEPTWNPLVVCVCTVLQNNKTVMYGDLQKHRQVGRCPARDPSRMLINKLADGLGIYRRVYKQTDQWLNRFILNDPFRLLFLKLTPKQFTVS